jgi:predicted P-loop ATPase
LVRELAGEGWYVELALGLESKEAHMMLQGAWVAEFSELDALSRTEETRLKAFITMKEDSYIPKFSNNRLRVKRRTVFIGTTNEGSYLKGLTGNTRYLPIKLGHAVDLPLFLSLRSQLFAEAIAIYDRCPTHWWCLRDESVPEARLQRDARRVENQYEVALQDWLARRAFPRDVTTWPEIASGFLEMPTPERWKDKGTQMLIAGALKALGWTNTLKRDGAKVQRFWAPPP